VGNRKKGTISERANKHLTELTTLANEGQSCAVVFMVMRNDVSKFSPNTKDEIFCNCLKNAYDAGVQVLVYQFDITRKGISFVKKLQHS
jgi:DNA-binding sugar fermentation-stimulating protein